MEIIRRQQKKKRFISKQGILYSVQPVAVYYLLLKAIQYPQITKNERYGQRSVCVEQHVPSMENINGGINCCPFIHLRMRVYLLGRLKLSIFNENLHACLINSNYLKREKNKIIYSVGLFYLWDDKTDSPKNSHRLHLNIAILITYHLDR